MSEQPFDIKILTGHEDEEVISPPNWEKPPLQEEMGEVRRTAEELKLDKEMLHAAYEAAGLEQLRDEDWVAMENCDSRDATWTSAEVAEHLAATRDGHPPYLVAGNSRLLGCRALNIPPTILAMRLNT